MKPISSVVSEYMHLNRIQIAFKIFVTYLLRNWNVQIVLTVHLIGIHVVLK